MLFLCASANKIGKLCANGSKLASSSELKKKSIQILPLGETENINEQTNK